MTFSLGVVEVEANSFPEIFGTGGNSKSYRRPTKHLMSYIRQLFLCLNSMYYALNFSLQNIISHIEKNYCGATLIYFVL
jgi:hypothetical protein